MKIYQETFTQFGREDIGKSFLIRLVPALDVETGELLPYYIGNSNFDNKEIEKYFFAYAVDGQQKVFSSGKNLVLKIAEIVDLGGDIYSPYSDIFLKITVLDSFFGSGYTFKYEWKRSSSAIMSDEDWNAIVKKGYAVKFGKSWGQANRGRSVDIVQEFYNETIIYS